MDRQKALNIISQNKTHLNEFHIKALYLFGSVSRDAAGSDSDVDILVKFNPEAHVGLFHLSRLRTYLSKILGCNADLVTEDALHPMLKDKILKETIRAA
jgi:uncharacterized protein